MAINAVNILPGDNKRELDIYYAAEVITSIWREVGYFSKLNISKRCF